MAQEKQFNRIEAKLDALLKFHKVDFKEERPTPAAAPRKLSAAEQQAIDNAPETPIADNAKLGPRVTATNAPDTSSSVPADAVGNATVETTSPDGSKKVETVPAANLKGDATGERK